MISIYKDNKIVPQFIRDKHPDAVLVWECKQQCCRYFAVYYSAKINKFIYVEDNIRIYAKITLSAMNYVIDDTFYGDDCGRFRARVIQAFVKQHKLKFLAPY